MKGNILAIIAVAAVSTVEKVDIEPKRYGVSEKQEAWIARFCSERNVLEGRV